MDEKKEKVVIAGKHVNAGHGFVAGVVKDFVDFAHNNPSPCDPYMDLRDPLLRWAEENQINMKGPTVAWREAVWPAFKNPEAPPVSGEEFYAAKEASETLTKSWVARGAELLREQFSQFPGAPVLPEDPREAAAKASDSAYEEGQKIIQHIGLEGVVCRQCYLALEPSEYKFVADEFAVHVFCKECYDPQRDKATGELENLGYLVHGSTQRRGIRPGMTVPENTLVCKACDRRIRDSVTLDPDGAGRFNTYCDGCFIAPPTGTGKFTVQATFTPPKDWNPCGFNCGHTSHGAVNPVTRWVNVSGDFDNAAKIFDNLAYGGHCDSSEYVNLLPHIADSWARSDVTIVELMSDGSHNPVPRHRKANG